MSPVHFPNRSLGNSTMNFRIFPTLVVAILSISGFAAANDGKTKSSSSTKIELIGTSVIAGTARDLSGLNQPLDDVSTNDMLGGFSAIAYTGVGDEYLCLSDRGPRDGAVDWSCRLQRYKIELTGNSDDPIKMELLETILLRDRRGIVYTGLASAFNETAEKTARLDPEGIRVSADGNFFVSDEYGPRLIEFKSDGSFVREFTMPKRLLIKNPGLAKADENPANDSGRQCNRGMEGLAITGDNKTLYGLMQSPLLQDSNRTDKPAKPFGLNCRMEQISVDGKFAKEFIYHLESKSNKLNEVLACGPNKFIVIERDGEVGTEAKFKKLTLISTSEATDVSGIKSLPVNEVPDGVKAVSKKVLIDLLDPKWKLAGSSMPEKIEGLAFGPDLPDGRRTLFVTSDNDFDKEIPSHTWVFAIPVDSLD